MIRRFTLSLLAVAALASPAHAATTFEYLFTGGFPTAISSDGTAIAGNTAGAFEPFRWTRSGGFQNLGMGSVPLLGAGGGAPGISADGTRVASTIVGPDTTYYTQGLWTLGTGWQTLIPPIPPGGGQIDAGLASVDGISGDGLTVVGLLWRTAGRAHACKWTQAGGAVDLGSATTRASKAMDVNHDASVIVGWNESELYGYRTPSVWLNDQVTLLAPDVIGEVWSSTPDGQTIGGFVRDEPSNQRQPALWHRVGPTGWSEAQILGVVPGTEPGSGINGVRALSADGELAVGYCSFGGDPFNTTGFIWTDSTGTIDIVQFLGERGILPDPSFLIQDLTCMTPDGRKIVGFGRDVNSPFTTRAFMIHLDRAVVGVEQPRPLGTRPALVASPNPARSQTTISFTLAQGGEGVLAVLDPAGRLVRRLHAGAFAAGPHAIRWDARDDAGEAVAPGIYFTRLVAGASEARGKVVVVR